MGGGGVEKVSKECSTVQDLLKSVEPETRVSGEHSASAPLSDKVYLLLSIDAARCCEPGTLSAPPPLGGGRGRGARNGGRELMSTASEGSSQVVLDVWELPSISREGRSQIHAFQRFLKISTARFEKDMSFEGVQGSSDTARGGDTRTVTWTLKPNATRQPRPRTSPRTARPGAQPDLMD